LPRPTRSLRHYYRKVGTRKAQAISKICFAGVTEVDEDVIKDVRIALGSVAPVPLRCPKTEEILRGRKVNAEIISTARRELAREISPIDDIRSTARYRLQVALNVLKDFLTTL